MATELSNYFGINCVLNPRLVAGGVGTVTVATICSTNGIPPAVALTVTVLIPAPAVTKVALFASVATESDPGPLKLHVGGESRVPFGASTIFKLRVDTSDTDVSAVALIARSADAIAAKTNFFIV